MSRPTSTASLARLLFITGMLLALALRLAYLMQLRACPAFAHPAVDAGYHDAWAKACVARDAKQLPPPTGAFPSSEPYFRPPGYPLFLAGIYRIFGDTPVAPRVAQASLGLLSLLLLGLFAGKWFGPVEAGLAVLLAGSYWGLIYFEGELLEPSLLVFCGIVMLLCMAEAASAQAQPPSQGASVATQQRWALLAGMAAGAQALVRPNVLLFIPLGAIWLYRKTRSPWAVSLFAAGTLACLLPVTFRNWSASRAFVPISANGGINLYIGNHDGADGLFQGKTPETGSFCDCSDYPKIVQALSRKLQRPLSFSDADRYFTRQALQWIAAHPAQAAKLAGKKILYLAGDDETGHNRSIYWDRRFLPVIRQLPGSWGFLFACCIAGLALVRRRPGAAPFSGVPGLVVLYASCYAVSFLPFFVTGQYRMPLVTWLCLGAAVAIVGAARSLWRGNWQRPSLAVALWIAAYGFSKTNWTNFSPDLAKWHYDEGVAWAAAGNLQKAEASYLYATRVEGQKTDAHYNLGCLEMGRRDWQEACLHFREALACATPSRAMVLNNLGYCLLRQGQLAESLGHFKEAVSIEPCNAEYLSNYATALLGMNKTCEAKEAFERALRLREDLSLAHYQLGKIHRESGNIAEARRHFQRAQALRPALQTQVEAPPSPQPLDL